GHAQMRHVHADVVMFDQHRPGAQCVGGIGVKAVAGERGTAAVCVGGVHRQTECAVVDVGDRAHQGNFAAARAVPECGVHVVVGSIAGKCDGGGAAVGPVVDDHTRAGAQVLNIRDRNVLGVEVERTAVDRQGGVRGQRADGVEGDRASVDLGAAGVCVRGIQGNGAAGADGQLADATDGAVGGQRAAPRDVDAG